jgi:diguanylate cyclase (GGDEF)-like protein/PAS domain S-box-containing protein
MSARICILLVDSDTAVATHVQRALANAGVDRFDLAWVRTRADGLARLRESAVSVILLGALDDDAPEHFAPWRRIAPDALILVLRRATGDPADDAVADEMDLRWLPQALFALIAQGASSHARPEDEVRFRAISDASPLGIFVSDLRGYCLYSNAAYQAIAGLTGAQALGTHWRQAIHPDDQSRVLAQWRQAASGAQAFQTEARFLHEDGRVQWVRLNTAPMGDAGATGNGYVQTVEDITARKGMESVLRVAEEALFAEKERAQVTLNSIGDAVLSTDLQGRVTYLNLVAETMTGWSMQEAQGRSIEEVFRIIDGTTRKTEVNPAHSAIAENRIVELASNCVLVRRDGSETAIEDSAAPIHDREARAVGAVIVFHDVSQSRAMTARMAHLAQHDFLTDLPNRALLTERLCQAIGLAQRRQKQLALLYLDLDHFKRINDSLGHTTGDVMLQAMAQRLLTCVRTTDTVCRQGGDEFVLLLTEIEQPQDCAHVAEKLLAVLNEPELIDGKALRVTASIGISVYPEDGISADTMMHNADTAMYHAKASGRNNFQFFTNEMNIRAVERLAVENRLHRALEGREFELYYQPKIDLVSGTMTGAEALIRWQDPELGQILPDAFVTIAEECGLIVDIGRWVLTEACRQVRAWMDAGRQVVPVAVNVSAVEFRRKDFLDGFTHILAAFDVPPRYIEIELTESVLMHDVESSLAVLRALKSMGVHLAIDDFGTGYSSLSYLKRFPIDALKIDRAFVRDITVDADDASIVAAVIGMGIKLKLKVIAEAVETEAQADFLRAHQCDEVQGYLFGLPMPATDFVRLLALAPDPPPTSY